MSKKPPSKLSQKRTATSADATDQVIFRVLSPAVMDELARRAEAAGKSVNLFARDVVIEALARGSAEDQQSARVEELQDQLQGVVEELRRARGDIATSTRILLITAGNQESDKATQWVREHLTT